MANFSVKAYLEKKDKSVEVRRFAMSKTESRNFDLLCSKLKLIFGSQMPEISKFAIFWKDEEGDEIRASSDEELVYALQSVKDDIFKIYIRKLKTNGSSGSKSKCFHPGVVCDSCNEEIYGHRYKCMECPNFDLCSSCEHVGSHADHNMMRMPLPMKSSHGFHSGCRSRRFHNRNWNRQSAGAEGGDSKGNRCGREPFHPYNFLNKMWSAFNVPLAGQQGTGPSASSQTNENAAADNANSNQAKNDDRRPFQEDYLRNFGEMVAAALDPLGIDVMVDVETSSTKEKESENSNKENKQQDEETGVSQGMPENDMETETQKAEKLNSMDTTEWTYINPETEEEVSNTLPEQLAGTHLQDGNPTSQPLHPNKVIAQAIEAMMAMGFTNENGWLSALLELYGGTITRVLDFLQSLDQPDGPSKQFIETFSALMERHNGDVAKVAAIMQTMRK